MTFMGGRGPGTTYVPADVARDVRKAVEAAVWAPSVHNTQPWLFGVRGPQITLRADPDRRLAAADPDGREMLISCGAALATLRIAARALGREVWMRERPDPDRPNLLADLDLGARTVDDEHARRLYGAVRRRRTHRGAFKPVPVSPSLLTALRGETEHDGVRVVQVVEEHTRQALAGLTQAAEHLLHLDPRLASEEARWAPAPGGHRADGVPESAYPGEVPRTDPHFPPRDFARGHDWGVRPAGPGEEPPEASVGLIALLTTEGDAPLDWLRTGQALQRMLLRAAAEEDLAAAFHTQALEIPELREFIRARFCNGRYPQMLLRLGVPEGPELTTVRRPIEEVLRDENDLGH